MAAETASGIKWWCFRSVATTSRSSRAVATRGVPNPVCSFLSAACVAKIDTIIPLSHVWLLAGKLYTISLSTLPGTRSGSTCLHTLIQFRSVVFCV